MSYKILILVLSICIEKNAWIDTLSKIAIVPLKFLNTVNSGEYNGKNSLTKLDYYKVINYNDDEEHNKYIGDFVKKNKETSSSKYSQYSITFFIASEETNINSLKQHPEKYYNQSNMICEYTWFNGRFAGVIKFKNGIIDFKHRNMIEPKSKIIIKDRYLLKDSL